MAISNEVERLFLMRSDAIEVTEAPPQEYLFMTVFKTSLEVRWVDPAAQLEEMVDVSLAEVPGDLTKGVIRRDYEYGREVTVERLDLVASRAVRSIVLNRRNVRSLRVHRSPMPDVDGAFGCLWYLDRFPQFPALNLEIGRVTVRSGSLLPKRDWILEDITGNPLFTPLCLLRHVKGVTSR